MIMKLSLLWMLIMYWNTVKAYDNFQGLGQLQRPCFPAYNHPRCKKPLWEVYDPSNGSDYITNTPETKLYLFTPSSQDKAEQLHKCAGGLPPGSTFNVSCPTEIFIPGLIDGVCRSAWTREIKEQLYQRSECYNILLVDWTWGSSFDSLGGYFNAKTVGEQVAYVLKKISRQKGYDCKNFHITGNSLGGTSASFAGKNMKGKCRLGRLTGLDWAFSPISVPKSERFNENDALFVDVYHTGGGSCGPPQYGDIVPSGHVDFYFNGGSFQYRSCLPYAFISFLKLDLLYGFATAVVPDVCSHAMSIQYYKTSVLAGRDHSEMVGVRCNNYEDFVSGKCSRDCTVPGNCLVAGMDTPLYMNTTDLGPSEQDGRIYYVPISSSCPYEDHSGFTGLPLKPMYSEAS